MIEPKLVTEITTQGGGDHADVWIDRYVVKYTRDGIKWYHADYDRDTESGKVFSGNTDRHGLVSHKFEHPFYARTVKIFLIGFTGSYPSMRFEVWFNDNFKAKLNSTGMTVEAVASGHPVTASSEYEPACGTQRARINYPRARQGCQSWRPETNSEEEWIQVNLDTPKYVTGVRVQGNNGNWVRWFIVKYSNDGREWFTYGNPMITFEGYGGNTVREVNFDTPFMARTVRIVPTGWDHDIGMRIEVVYKDPNYDSEGNYIG